MESYFCKKRIGSIFPVYRSMFSYEKVRFGSRSVSLRRGRHGVRTGWFPDHRPIFGYFHFCLDQPHWDYPRRAQSRIFVRRKIGRQKARTGTPISNHIFRITDDSFRIFYEGTDSDSIGQFLNESPLQFGACGYDTVSAIQHASGNGFAIRRKTPNGESEKIRIHHWQPVRAFDFGKYIWNVPFWILSHSEIRNEPAPFPAFHSARGDFDTPLGFLERKYRYQKRHRNHYWNICYLYRFYTVGSMRQAGTARRYGYRLQSSMDIRMNSKNQRKTGPHVQY